MTPGVVIDTNIIISAVISSEGKPAIIMRLISANILQMYYSSDILYEYAEVLSRDKFGFSLEKQLVFLKKIEEVGILVNPAVSSIKLPDETDRIFYDVA